MGIDGGNSLREWKINRSAAGRVMFKPVEDNIGSDRVLIRAIRLCLSNGIKMEAQKSFFVLLVE